MAATSLGDAVKAVQDAEASLEAREAAHQAQNQQTIADLQKTVQDLENGADKQTAIDDLNALAARIAAFDPDNPPTGGDGTTTTGGDGTTATT